MIIHKISVYLLYHYPCGEIPRGDMSQIARKFGVSRERVRQLAAKAELTSVSKTKIPLTLCAKCNGELKKFDLRYGGFCFSCRRIDVFCETCGKPKKVMAGTVTAHMRTGKYKGRFFCDRKCFGRWFGENIGRRVKKERRRGHEYIFL